MAVTAIGTAKQAWTDVVPGDKATLSDPKAYMVQTTVPSTGSGIGRITIPTTGNDAALSNLIEIFFYAENAAGITGTVRIWAFDPGSSGQVGTYLGEVLITLGNNTGVAGTQIPAGYRGVSVIQLVGDYTLSPPGMRVRGAAPDALAILVLDTLGSADLIVEIKMGQGATNAFRFGWRVA